MKEKIPEMNDELAIFFEQNTDARDMVMKFLEQSELDVDFVPKKNILWVTTLAPDILRFCVFVYFRHH